MKKGKYTRTAGNMRNRDNKHEDNNEEKVVRPNNLRKKRKSLH